MILFSVSLLKKYERWLLFFRLIRLDAPERASASLNGRTEELVHR